MRIPPSVFAVGRYALVLGVIAGSVALLSADKNKKAVYSPHDKAYYADPSVIEYVQPGLTFSIVSATIGSDGTVNVDYKITDPTGAPLDLSGVVTPGAVSPRFALAYIAKGNTWFTSYWQSTSTNATTGFVSTHPSGDSGGTTKTVAVGEYIYTFGNKATGFDPTLTNRLIIYGSRNLTTWDLGTSYADAWFDFVPNGSKVTVTRDIVRTASCNKCHDSLAFHGGTRRDVQVCVVCHQPQNTDSNGNSADMKVMIHQIHMGSQLPSVQAGTPYQLGSTDWSTVVLPSDPRRCQFCHESTTGATQASNWETNPSRAACGSCHNDVNFASGKNHAGGLPQANDSQCSQCHVPNDGGEFDASIEGAHVMPENSVQVPGLNVAITKVTNTNAGQAPIVTFTVKDNKGNNIPLATMATGSFSFTLTGPTTDYGNTNFGSDVTTPGYVTESTVAKSATCGGDGTCTYTFTHVVPKGAKGTFAIGSEARLSATLQAGTVNQQTVNYATPNPVVYFSVDGSPIVKRRSVVALANCNNCHAKLELHGSLRNNTEYCVFCHNPNGTDSPTRPSATNPADKGLPNQGINLTMMVHKIHTGTNLMANFNQDYVIVGFGGSHNSFGATFASVPAAIPNTGVRYPAMSPTGAVHDTTNCAMCHVNSSESNLPVGLNNVTDPQGLITSAPATTSACTACHLNLSAFAHASMNTDPKFGESCSVCHGAGAAYDPAVVHAGQ